MKGKESILIVDDDESTCRSLSLIFGKKGYRIETAWTGREAIEKAQGKLFNAALLDIRLPDMEGVELVAPLRKILRDIALIMVTAYPSLETAVRALNNGASAYITKPLNMDEVLAKVTQALEKQRLVMEERRLYQEAQRELAEGKKAEKALVQSERLRALGEMAGGVAHDFNNLLAIILGNAQLLEKRLKRYKSEQIKERLRIIAKTSYEGGETVRRLQHFTRRASKEEFTQLNLNEIVRSAISSTSPRWKDEAEVKGITIKIKENLGDVPLILGSRSGLMEVLTNLIFNSVEAIRKGGEITVRTQAKGNEVFLYFSDTGEGMPKRIKDKIFNPFFTTKGPHSSGLGLSVSHGIIKHHKGNILVESREGKGTTFIISIPIPSQAPPKKEEPKRLKKISSRRILVIDDEEGVRDVLGRILEDEGHRVVLAETSRGGLEEFKKNGFDLVLTDLGMPEMSGWEVAKEIKEIDPEIPVGLVTGWAVATTEEKMREEGVDFILSKPFDYTRVLREVNSTLKSERNSHSSQTP